MIWGYFDRSNKVILHSLWSNSNLLPCWLFNYFSTKQPYFTIQIISSTNVFMVEDTRCHCLGLLWLTIGVTFLAVLGLLWLLLGVTLIRFLVWYNQLFENTFKVQNLDHLVIFLKLYAVKTYTVMIWQ